MLGWPCMCSEWRRGEYATVRRLYPSVVLSLHHTSLVAVYILHVKTQLPESHSAPIHIRWSPTSAKNLHVRPTLIKCVGPELVLNLDPLTCNFLPGFLLISYQELWLCICRGVHRAVEVVLLSGTQANKRAQTHLWALKTPNIQQTVHRRYKVSLLTDNTVHTRFTTWCRPQLISCSPWTHLYMVGA